MPTVARFAQRMPRRFKPRSAFRIHAAIIRRFTMPFKRGTIFCILPLFVLLLAAFDPPAQSGNAGAIRGTVTDPSGAVIPNATVHLTNATSGLDRTVSSDATGQFLFSNIPFNPYRIGVSAPGFASLSQPVLLRSVVGTNLQ